MPFVLSILWLLALAIPIAAEQIAYFRFVASNPKEQDRYSKVAANSELVWDSAHLLGLIAAIYRFFNVPSEPLTAMMWLGYAVYLCGVILRIVSLREIGRSYARKIVVRDAAQLVRTGPYRLFRHPLHIGTTLEIVGLSAFFPLPVTLIILIITVATTVYRNYYEEKALIEHLGPAYRETFRGAWDLLDLFAPFLPDAQNQDRR